MNKKEIAKVLDNIDLSRIAYKMNKHYRKPESFQFIPLLPRVESYKNVGICQRHIWDRMAEIALKEVKRALNIKPLKRGG